MSCSIPKKNALVHGLYSDCIVLDGENPQEFSDMLELFRDEYPPQGIWKKPWYSSWPACSGRDAGWRLDYNRPSICGEPLVWLMPAPVGTAWPLTPSPWLTSYSRADCLRENFQNRAAGRISAG